MQPRERGLSASALDQGRVVSQIRNKSDIRNYSVGVHKKMHNGPPNTHPSQGAIGMITQQYSSDGPGSQNNTMHLTQQNRPTASGKKVIKALPMRSPHSLTRGMPSKTIQQPGSNDTNSSQT